MAEQKRLSKMNVQAQVLLDIHIRFQDLKQQLESVDDCARLCTKTKGCNGFHYYGKDDKAEKDCYIKQEVTKVTKSVGDGRIRYGGICKPPGIRIQIQS